MERLTIPDVRVDEHTTRRSIIDVLAVQEHVMEIYHQLKIYEDIAELCGGFDRLRELAEADKDGRVVVLPCKVGDTVYILRRAFDGADVVGETELWWDDIPQLGKTVFLTREEAEKALQEMEGKS
mgnify:CR=1 FL=1